MDEADIPSHSTCPSARKTLRQEIDEARAMATPRGQLALDWLLRQVELADDRFSAAQVCLGFFMEGETNGDVRDLARKLLDQTEFACHVLGREFQAP